jgi:CHAD domain-containing protein
MKMISQVESFWLNWHARRDSPSVARRARILLLADNGVPSPIISSRTHTGPGTVTRVLNEFQKKRLDSFPRPLLSVSELLRAAKVDLAHARRVSSVSLQLFHIMELSYRLPSNLVSTLQTAAFLHNLGMAIDQANHHLAGRDILQHVQLRGFSKSQQRAIACLVRFHRKRVRSEEEPLFTKLTPAWRQRTLQLAAILRVADGLDFSQTQSTQIINSVSSPEAIQLNLTGSQASTDGRRAKRKSDLWETVFHIPLESLPIIPPPDLMVLQNQALTLESPLASVIQRMMARQLLRWQTNESALLAGDLQGTKEVRCAVRRIRKTLEITEGCLRRKTSKKILRPIIKLESLLGRVRDLDILILDAKNYLADKPSRPSTDPVSDFPVISIWEREQRKAQAELVEWLGENSANALQAKVLSFLADPPILKDSPLASEIEAFFTSALREVKKRQVNLSRENLKTYHRMRLALRNFRYSLELCGEALGPSGEALRMDIAKVQKRLGFISDAWLIQEKTARVLDEWAETQALQNAPQLHGAQPILEYLQARRRQLPKLTSGISKDWKPVRYAELSKRIKGIVKALKKDQPAAPPSIQ